MATVARIRTRLADLYGVPGLAPHGHPIAELVLTVLSQSTNDRNRDVAYVRLRERWGADGGTHGSWADAAGRVAAGGGSPDGISWEAVRDAPVASVEEAIRPGGISKVKSARIVAILEAISARGELSLDWLPDVAVAEAQAYLCTLPGVGRKTAACVLLFAFGLRDVPVDTHVGRVGARLRLLPETGTSERLHDAMVALTPPGAELELHMNLLRHGRRTCHARVPDCGACGLARHCPSARV
jgi:endonuclease III